MRLLNRDNALLRAVPTSARELRWSPDGATLALRTAEGRLSLLDLRDAKARPTNVAEDATGFAWSPDGRLLFGVARRGISAIGADGKSPTPILPKAETPAPSPDGTRLAFTVSGAGGGLWSAGADGANPRRLAAGESAANASWSNDSRLLAWTEGGRLKLIRRDGAGARDLGPVEDPRPGWSPGSADLLARRNGAWAV